MAHKRMKYIGLVLVLVLMMSVSLAVMAAAQEQSGDKVPLWARYGAEQVEPMPDAYNAGLLAASENIQ